MKYLLILFAFILSSLASFSQAVQGPQQITGQQSRLTLVDTAGIAVVSGAYPVAVYDVSNRYIGTVYNPTDLVALWNSVVYNQRVGILSKSTDSFHFIFSQVSGRVSANKRFTPTNVTSATLKAWYDLTDGATVTTVDTPNYRISKILDKSGNGFDLTQTTDGLRPYYHPTGNYSTNHLPYMSMYNNLIGNNSMSFATPAQIYMVMRVNSNNDGNSTPYTYFSLLQLQSSITQSGIYTVINNTVNPAVHLLHYGTGFFGQAPNWPNSSYRAGKWIASSWGLINGAGTLRYNNESYTTGGGGVTTASFDRFILNAADVDISEIIVFTGTISTADDKAIRAYLVQKYHISPSEVFLFFGDSITAGQNSTDASVLSFASLMAQIRGANLINTGVAFTTIDSLNTSFPGVPGQNFSDQVPKLQTSVYDPDHTTIFINYGSNDYPYVMGGGATIWIAKYKKYIGQLIGNGFHPDRIILGGPPFQTSRTQDSLLMTYISQVANETGVKFFNSVDWTKKHGGESLITHPDSVHLNNNGHLVFAQGLLTVIGGAKTTTQNPALNQLGDVDMSAYDFSKDGAMIRMNNALEKWQPFNPNFVDASYTHGAQDTTAVDLIFDETQGIADSIAANGAGREYYGTLNADPNGFENRGGTNKMLAAGQDGYIQYYLKITPAVTKYFYMFFSFVKKRVPVDPTDYVAGVYMTGNVNAIDGSSGMVTNPGQAMVKDSNFYYRIKRTNGVFTLEKSANAISWTNIYNYTYHDNGDLYIYTLLDKKFNDGHLYYPKCFGCTMANTLYPRRNLNVPDTVWTPATGNTITLLNNYINVINPSGNILSLNMNLPAFPQHGDALIVVFTKRITTPAIAALTGSVVVNAGAVADSSREWRFYYNQSTNTWYGSQSFAGGSGGGGGGLTGFGTFDSGTPDAKGASVSGANIINQSATASVPGMVNTGTQTIAGNKTLNGNLTSSATSVWTIVATTDNAQHFINHTNLYQAFTYSGSGAEYASLTTDAPVGVPHLTYKRLLSSGPIWLDLGYASPVISIKGDDGSNPAIVVAASNNLNFITGSTVDALFNTSGHFAPGATNTFDIGTSSSVWRDFYIRHIIPKSASAPTTGTLGSNITSATPAANCTDESCSITIVSSGICTGAIFELTYNAAWPNTPNPVISQGNNATGGTQAYFNAYGGATNKTEVTGFIPAAGTFIVNIHTFP